MHWKTTVQEGFLEWIKINPITEFFRAPFLLKWSDSQRISGCFRRLFNNVSLIFIWWVSLDFGVKEVHFLKFFCESQQATDQLTVSAMDFYCTTVERQPLTRFLLLLLDFLNVNDGRLFTGPNLLVVLYETISLRVFSFIQNAYIQNKQTKTFYGL